MSKEVRIIKTFPVSREELFKYFTNAELMEQWAFPEGMKLRLPQFDARKEGRYRFEHRITKGTFVAVGRFTEFVPNQKIVMLDESVFDPDGKQLYQDLKCTQVFRDSARGAQVEIYHEGFDTEESARECRESWEQCFDHLSVLIDRELGSQISI